MRLVNRESPRILANRIFLAPSCSAPAYRLRRNRTQSGKMLGKNPRAGFSHLILYSSFFNWGAGPRLRRGAARGGDIPRLWMREMGFFFAGSHIFLKSGSGNLLRGYTKQ